MVHLFIHLLIHANYEDKEWNGIILKRGQFATGLNALNRDTGISIQSTRTLLKKLEFTKEIIVNSTNKYSIITICKYNDYQIESSGTNKQLTNNQQTTNKQLTTTKEYKEYKEDNKEISSWRKDFSIYQKECADEFTRLAKDQSFLKKLKLYNANVDIMKSLQKLFDDYWNTEEGWINKKKSKVSKINWATTISNTIKFHKVYYTKQEIAEMEQR